LRPLLGDGDFSIKRKRVLQGKEREEGFRASLRAKKGSKTQGLLPLRHAMGGKEKKNFSRGKKGKGRGKTGSRLGVESMGTEGGGGEEKPGTVSGPLNEKRNGFY